MRPFAYLFVATSVLSGCVADTADDTGPAGGKGDGSSCSRAAGEVDRCFGFHPIADLEAVAVAAPVVQTDGKILVFGTAQDRASATPRRPVPFVRRLLANGKPDSTFTADLPIPYAPPYTGSIFQPTTLALRPDGRMIVAGSFGDSYAKQLSVQQLLPSGARDPASRSGSFWPPSSLLGWTSDAVVNKVLLEQDGSYYLVGTTECIAAFTCDTRAMFVAHFDATGTLDASFGTSGYALIKSGRHTRVIDAVRFGDATFVLGVESEPYFLHGHDTSFNRVVVGKVTASGALDASFATAGVFSWSAPGSQLGTIPQAFQVRPDGSITIATQLPANQIVALTSDGKTVTPHEYRADNGVRFARFARDGSLFAEVTSYPIAAFGRFALDGTSDSTFTKAVIEVPDVPTGTVFLGATAVEQSDAWLVNGHLFMGADAMPESQMMLFRLWK
ncbi:MAG: delta-60 repeat domain-containing protein [Myxococcales bacterium]|nr:delta-60 repeat domain-containing protein [Myxococcales bacterium]